MKISVYITSYNQKDFLVDAIESVLAQTMKPFEIIIVDDGSTDGSQEVIRQYASDYKIIRPIYNDNNIGIAGVRKRALNDVKGDFVTYVDGDDLYLPNKLELESKLIDKFNCDFSFSNNMYVNPNDLNEVKWIWANNEIKIVNEKQFFLKTLIRDFPRGNLFRMELVNYSFLKKVGFHDSNLDLYEDYDLRIRMSKFAIPKYSLEPTSKIRISETGLSTSRKQIHRKSFHYIFKKYESEINDFDIDTQYWIKIRLNQLLLDLGEEKDNLPFQIPSITTKQKFRNLLKRF